MKKIEKIISTSIFVLLAVLLNVMSCYKAGIFSNTIYYLIYSLIPYFIFSLFAAYMNNRAVIYMTAVFMLLIDYLMKSAINSQTIISTPKLAYSWVLMAPLLLVSLIFLVLIIYITLTWICRKKGISTLNITFGLPTQIRFEDEELGKFVFVILAIGFLVNFQNIINVSTTVLSAILGFAGVETIFTSGILLSIFGMFPYLIFVGISYFVNSRGISYLVGFIAITFDIYLKIISQIFLNSGMDFGSNFADVINSIFNPVTISMFIPMAFALLIFGKKLFEKNKE